MPLGPQASQPEHPLEERLSDPLGQQWSLRAAGMRLPAPSVFADEGAGAAIPMSLISLEAIWFC